MKNHKVKITLAIIAVLIVAMGLFITILIARNNYYLENTKVYETAKIHKVKDHFLVKITHKKPVFSTNDLTPGKLLFPNIIKATDTLKVHKIEGEINMSQISIRKEGDYDFKEFDYNGFIEFNDRKEMIINLHNQFSESFELNGKYKVIYIE